MTAALPRLGVLALLAGAFAVFLTGSMWSRTADTWGAFWPANGFLVVLFLLARRPQIPPFAAIAFVLNALIAFWVGGRSPADVLLGAIGNLSEALLVAWLTVRFIGRTPNFASLWTLLKFGGVVVLALAPVVLAVGLIRLTYADFDLAVLPRWVLEDGLGILMTVPSLWILVSPDRSRAAHAVFDRSVLEVACLFVALTATEVFLLRQSELPALFVIFPLLVAVSFRLGPRGAAWSVFLTGSLAFGLTVAGEGATSRLLLQLFVLSAALTALASAGAVAEQARLRAGLGSRLNRANKRRWRRDGRQRGSCRRACRIGWLCA